MAVIGRGLLLVAGVLVAANAVWVLTNFNFNTGVAFQLLLAALLILAGCWPRLFRSRWVWVPASAVATVFALSGLLLAVVGQSDTAADQEDALIVLGAAVNGSRVSPALAHRLDVAVDYHARNPRALIVVTGGRGPQEDLTEAEAAATYLAERGVPSELVVEENRSTSTEENFAFARALLDQRLPAGYQVAFVTNEYHVWRAARLAARAGLDARHLHSQTGVEVLLSSYLREVPAAAWSLLG